MYPPEARIVHHLQARNEKLGVIARPVLSHKDKVSIQFGLRLVQVDLDEKNNQLVLSTWVRYVSCTSMAGFNKLYNALALSFFLSLPHTHTRARVRAQRYICREYCLGVLIYYLNTLIKQPIEQSIHNIIANKPQSQMPHPRKQNRRPTPTDFFANRNILSPFPTPLYDSPLPPYPLTPTFPSYHLPI